MADEKEAKLVVCTVCGAGSHRADWQDGKAHACDSHGEVAKAKAAVASGKVPFTQKETAPAPAAPPPDTGAKAAS
jgi:hypothetical protein